MDTVGFIALLVEKLPVELRRKWVSEALKIETKTGTLAGFKDFAKFVISESESVEANSTYFRAVFPARSTKNDDYGFKQRKTHTFATTTSTKGTAQATSPVKAESPKKTEEKPQKEARSLSCYCCGQQHKLSKCDEFLQKSYSEKRSVVRDKQLCYPCLRPGHLIKECRSAVESCKLQNQWFALLSLAKVPPIIPCYMLTQVGLERRLWEMLWRHVGRAGEPELGAPEPSIFLKAGVGAVIWICCGVGAGAINETISSGSEWFKILTKPSLQFLAQKDHLVC